MRILISGLCGRMGKEVARLAMNGYRNAEAAAGVDIGANGTEEIPCVRRFADADTTVDCIVDFSHHSCTAELLTFAVRNRIPAVIATTGHSEGEKNTIAAAAQRIPLFYSANYSIGIALLIEFAKTAVKCMPDAEIEIIEKHHDQKLDAPSGTALAIADGICSVRQEAVKKCGRNGFGKRTPQEIGIHAVRLGNITGEHEVMICSGSQTLTLKHEAHDRSLFAEGALAAAAFLCSLPADSAGLFGMQDLIAAAKL